MRQTAGAEALPVICELLQASHEDVDLVRSALECLLATLGPPPTAASGQQVKPEPYQASTPTIQPPCSWGLTSQTT